MYAWPAYGGNTGRSVHGDGRLLRWASWVISLPGGPVCLRPFFFKRPARYPAERISMDLPGGTGDAITFVVSSIGTFDPEGVFGHGSILIR